MKYAADELLATDRAVRVGLGVRDGQTIADRAREVLVDGGPKRERRMGAAVAVLSSPGWDGIKAAAGMLAEAEFVDALRDLIDVDAAMRERAFQNVLFK